MQGRAWMRRHRKMHLQKRMLVENRCENAVKVKIQVS
jgi:hypothetical protein